MSRLRRLGWNQCSHGLSSRPLESDHHQCLSAVCGVLGYPKGSAGELLDGSLKLQCCTTVFTKQFLPWSLPSVGNGGGKRWDVTPGHSSDDRGSTVKMVRLTRKTRPGALTHCNPDPGHSTPRRWKRLRPSSEGEGGEVGVPRNLFPRLGLDEACTRRSLERAFGGNRRRGFFRLVSPAEVVSALASAHFNQVHACVNMARHVFVIAPSAPPPPPGVSLECCRFPCDVFRGTQAVAMSDLEWGLLRVAEKAAAAPLVVATRADDRRGRARSGLAPQPWCWLRYCTKPHGDRRLRAQGEGGPVSRRSPSRQWLWSTRPRAPGLLFWWCRRSQLPSLTASRAPLSSTSSSWF